MSHEHPQLEEPQLMLNDFDGTTALTSEEAEGVPTVDDGYASGIDELFGPKAAEVFLKNGGHRHRAPAEIVAEIADSDAQDPEVKAAARSIVARKLEILSNAIGHPLADRVPWPRQTEGFSSTWHAVIAAQREGFPLGTAVISAGHTDFEREVFDMWGLEQPNVFLTDDVLNALALDIPPEKQVKPSPMLVEMAQMLHGFRLRVTHDDFKRTVLLPSQIRTVHVGDADKDRRLAKNAGIDFVMINQDRQRESWEEVNKFLGIGSFVVANA